MRSLRTGYRTAIASVLVFGLIGGASAVSYAQTGNPNPMRVFVTNGPESPVPVAGTVAVSNLPATQAIEGSVAVSNLPATQTVQGRVTVETSAEAPLRVQSVDDPEVQQLYVKVLEEDSSQCADSLTAEGRRIVIERVIASTMVLDRKDPLPVTLTLVDGDFADGYPNIVVPQHLSGQDGADAAFNGYLRAFSGTLEGPIFLEPGWRLEVCASSTTPVLEALVYWRYA